MIISVICCKRDALNNLKGSLLINLLACSHTDSEISVSFSIIKFYTLSENISENV